MNPQKHNGVLRERGRAQTAAILCQGEGGGRGPCWSHPSTKFQGPNGGDTNYRAFQHRKGSVSGVARRHRHGPPLPCGGEDAAASERSFIFHQRLRRAEGKHSKHIFCLQTQKHESPRRQRGEMGGGVDKRFVGGGGGRRRCQTNKASVEQLDNFKKSLNKL